MKAKIKKDTLVSYDIMFVRGQIEEARKEHAAIEILKANNFRYDAMINHLDKLVINLNHEANKDGGTSVGFSSDFILSGHGNLPQAAATNTVVPIDFKIKENLEVINNQEWEGIWNEYQKSEKGQSFFYSFYDWLRENYFAPEKKIS